MSAPRGRTRASLYTRVAADVLFPLHERVKRHSTVRRLHALEESQWWPPERIAVRQAETLRAFLADIAANVPYYGALFRDRHLDPQAADAAATLAQLPLLAKADIRANRDAMVARDARDLKRYNTGGSSGEPLVFFIGKERSSHDVAAKWRATRWWGVDIGDPELVVWGSPIELKSQDRLRALRDRMMRSRLFPAFDMSPARLDALLASLAADPPRMVFGYPSALSHIATHAAMRGVRLDGHGIAVAFVTSERLYDDQRRRIERAFGCPVANGYGARDAGFIAHECPAGGMHICAEDIVVEIVDRDGRAVPAGTAGEIVVTHMATRDFPFVRYRTGDVGALGTAPCACGRGLPLLAEIEGRTTDFVVAQDGTVMHGLALIYSVRDLPGVERFRIVQHARDHTEVELVTSADYPADADERIRADFRARLGAGVTVSVNHVAAIAAEASGKYRYVVSNVRGGGERERETERA